MRGLIICSGSDVIGKLMSGLIEPQTWTVGKVGEAGVDDDGSALNTGLRLIAVVQLLQMNSNTRPIADT